VFFIDINPPVISIVGFTSHGFMSAIFSTPLKIPAILIIHLVTNKRLGKNNLEPGMNKSSLYTLPETNIAPENRPSQKETSIPTIHFQVQTVSFREGNSVTQISLLHPASMCKNSHLPTPQKRPPSLEHRMQPISGIGSDFSSALATGVPGLGPGNPTVNLP